MEQKYKEFQAYNFAANDKWLAYMDAIFPPPPMSKIEYYKKKFYRLHVDKDFDVNYDPNQKPANEQPQNTGPAPQNNPPQEETKNENASSEPRAKKSVPWQTKIQMVLFTAFLLTFPMGHIAHSYYHGIPLALAFIIGIWKKHGMIKFNKLYFQALLWDEHLHNLISTIICIISTGGTVVIWIPLILRALIFIAECIGLLAKSGSKFAQLGNKITGKITANKEFLMVLKGDLEIYVGFYLIIAIFMRWVSLIMPLFYWQIMQVKYMLNGYTRSSFDKLADQMDYIIAQPNSPFFVKLPLKGLRKLGSYLSKMGQPDANANQNQAPRSN